jgi:hypothetical protein
MDAARLEDAGERAFVADYNFRARHRQSLNAREQRRRSYG